MKKSVKKILVFALALLMIVSILPLSVEKAEAATKSSKVIKIRSYEDLANITKKTTKSSKISTKNKTYKLMKDLELEPGQTYEPIELFEGVFDGNGHSIEVDIEKEDADYLGVFGLLDHATVKNLTVTGVIKGRESIGAIAGKSVDSKIVNCVNKAKIDAVGHCGGIVGRLLNGKIYNCMNSGKLTASSYGLGGIVGFIDGNGSIINCANVGAIYGGLGYTGGIAGGAETGSIKNCVNSVNIISASGSAGGIMGNTKYKGTMSNNYFYKDETVNAHYKAYGKNCTGYNKDLKLSKKIKVAGKTYTSVLDALNYWAKAKSTSSMKLKNFGHDNAIVTITY